MPRKLDPIISDALKAHGLGPEACWDCHGTWVVYHRAIEQMAARSGIKFGLPVVLEARGDAKCVAICVSATLGDKSEWSIGEAAPGNNKNAYPYAMAEKRAKDRVTLKLIGLHGLVYSEEEMQEPKSQPADDHTAHATELISELKRWKQASGLEQWAQAEGIKAQIASLDEANRERVRGAYAAHMKTLRPAAA